MKKIAKKLLRNEKGQALPMVLILMVVGGLILTPMLAYTTSGLKVGQAYERMAEEFYAADAGIEDGLWQIKYDHLEELFDDYERYRYNHEYGPYDLNVNGIDVEIKIENVWIPDISEPSLDDANRLAETDKLIIAGCVSADMTQQVKIHYKQETGDPDLFITSIGVWLPPGFSYDESGECTLETHLNENPDVDYTREITPHKGGEIIVWSFADPAPFTAFPGVNTMDTPMTCSFTFKFLRDNPASQRNPEAVSWLTASGVAGFPYTWDADVSVYHINSVANGEDGTTIDAYAIKSDPRQLVSGVEGDYRAIGNTLMLNLYPDWGGPVRDHLLNENTAAVDDIPANAHVDAAFLYWSAWILAEEEEETVFVDDCDDIWDKWIPGSDWDDYWQYTTRAFRAHHSYYGDPELVLKEAIPLNIYESATLSFDYWDDGRLEGDDCLKYAFSDDGGSTWSGWHEVFCDDTYGGTATIPVPAEYLAANFKVKFRIEGFDGGGYGGTEYCYIDDIEITAKLEEETVADTEVFFEIGGEPVYLAEDINGELTIPTQGEGSIFANKVRVIPNDDTPENDYSYCCRTDVTPLVQAYADHGNEIYTVGGVDGTLDSQWSYAGWSLVIIYSSPETQRHYLYMSDIEEFRYIAPNGPGISFPISGFLVPDPITDPDTGEIIETTAATITCFLGDGDDYYSGDFIAINAPEGLEGPQIPNSYKLWDGITLYAEWGWPQPRMDNLEYSPNNVWNSRSTGFGGEEVDGVDIDTFYVPWGDPPSDGLLKPGDSSATITLNFAGSELYTAELLNFIYIIIAFRSETVTGGTVTYLIEG